MNIGNAGHVKPIQNLSERNDASVQKKLSNSLEPLTRTDDKVFQTNKVDEYLILYLTRVPMVNCSPKEAKSLREIHETGASRPLSLKEEVDVLDLIRQIILRIQKEKEALLRKLFQVSLRLSKCGSGSPEKDLHKKKLETLRAGKESLSWQIELLRMSFHGATLQKIKLLKRELPAQGRPKKKAGTHHFYSLRSVPSIRDIFGRIELFPLGT